MCPELVDESGAYLAVDYARLSAVLIESVKELRGVVSALESKVAALQLQLRLS